MTLLGVVAIPVALSLMFLATCGLSSALADSRLRDFTLRSAEGYEEKFYLPIPNEFKFIGREDSFSAVNFQIPDIAGMNLATKGGTDDEDFTIWRDHWLIDITMHKEMNPSDSVKARCYGGTDKYLAAVSDIKKIWDPEYVIPERWVGILCGRSLAKTDKYLPRVFWIYVRFKSSDKGSVQPLIYDLITYLMSPNFDRHPN